MGNRKLSQQNLKIDSQVAGESTTDFKFKNGERIFHIKVEDSDDGDTEVLAGELEKTFLGQVVNKPVQGAEEKTQRNTLRKTALSSVDDVTRMGRVSFAESSEQKRWMKGRLCVGMSISAPYV